MRDSLACSCTVLTWRHSCRLLVTRGMLCHLSLIIKWSHSHVSCCRDKVVTDCPSCVYSCTATQDKSLCGSHSWSSRVSKGRKGNIQNRKLPTLLSLMPSVSLRFQESSHTKQRIPSNCFGLGGAQDKSAVTCSLPRPRAPTQPPCAQVSQERPHGLHWRMLLE